MPAVDRREFIVGAGASLLTTRGFSMPQTLTVWVACDAHCHADLNAPDPHPVRESLGDAIRDSETHFNHWDIGLNLGDFSAKQGLPEHDEGVEVIRQFGALQHHSRSSIYTIGGNHDRGGVVDPSGWLRIYVDPVGENTAISGVSQAAMPYPISGDWSHYTFRVGNLDFVMLSDVTRPNTSLRGLPGFGGDPGGVIRSESYRRWIDECEAARQGGRMVITGAHYMPRNTTAFTYDGGRDVPAHGPGLIPEMASYFAYIDDQPHKFLFSEYMMQNPGACAVWLGGHNHLRPQTDSAGRGMHGEWYGTYFVQCGALTNNHGSRPQLFPRSRLLTFTDGSDVALMQTYFHLAVDPYPKGFHPNTVAIQLPRAVEL